MPRILVCEIDKCGLDHVFFNASMLDAILLAFPDNKVTFLSERLHWETVRSVLEEHGTADRSRLEWRAFDFHSPRLGLVDRLRHERRWTGEVRRILREDAYRFVLVCSVSDAALLALKLRMLAGAIDTPAVAVPHSPLAALAVIQSQRWWRRVVNFRSVLRLPHPSKLRFLALGDSILDHVQRYAPRQAQHFRSLDHTYFWRKSDIEINIPPRVVQFGFLGVTGRNKGFDDFYRVADTITDESRNAGFHLVGFVRDPAELGRYGDAVQGMTTQPLDPTRFRERIEPLTYVVWTGEPRHYELTASATFLDTLSYLKPGIFYRNAFIESYFEKLGDIGYLCDSFEEMTATIRQICHEFPVERYRAQCENIVRGRSLFDPATQAPRLRAIVEELEGGTS